MQCDDCIYGTNDTCSCENVMFDIDDNCLSKIDNETYGKIYNKAIDDCIKQLLINWETIKDIVDINDFIRMQLEELKRNK